MLRAVCPADSRPRPLPGLGAAGRLICSLFGVAGPVAYPVGVGLSGGCAGRVVGEGRWRGRGLSFALADCPPPLA